MMQQRASSLCRVREMRFDELQLVESASHIPPEARQARLPDVGCGYIRLKAKYLCLMHTVHISLFAVISSQHSCIIAYAFEKSKRFFEILKIPRALTESINNGNCADSCADSKILIDKNRRLWYSRVTNESNGTPAGQPRVAGTRAR